MLSNESTKMSKRVLMKYYSKLVVLVQVNMNIIS